MEIKNRVIGLEYIMGRDLRPHAKNPRMHPERQIKALDKVLKQVGIADSLVVYRAEDSVMTIIDGHCRGENWQDVEWPCLVLDVTDQEADVILATLDPLSGLAIVDDDAMSKLLQNLDIHCAELLGLASAKPPVTEADLKPILTERPIECVWVLVHAPVSVYPKVDAAVQSLLALDGVWVEVSVGSEDKANR